MEIILKNLMVQLSFEEQLDINQENQMYLWGGVCVCGGVSDVEEGMRMRNGIFLLDSISVFHLSIRQLTYSSINLVQLMSLAIQKQPKNTGPPGLQIPFFGNLSQWQNLLSSILDNPLNLA